MKYGFFGGAFNPPTCAHFELAKKVRRNFGLDKVFFVPVGNSYEKDNLIDEKYRYEMLKILCSKYEDLEVSDLEMNINKDLKAIDVFKMIEKKYNKEILQDDIELYFIIGSDNLIKMDTWKSADELISKYKYIILEREEDDLEKIFEEGILLKKYKENFKILKKDKHYKTSSTKVREYIKQNAEEEVCNMIPEEIYEYILKNKLYIK